MPLLLSLALIVSDTVSPSLLVWSAGVTMLTGLLTFQVKLWLALEVPSPALTVTLYGPSAAAPAATVPVMVPVLVLIFRPGGRPVGRVRQGAAAGRWR